MTSCAKHEADPKVPGGPIPVGDSILETAASITQDFAPVKNICAHLNAFHIYADDPSRKVETNHYCSHISSGPYPLHIPSHRVRTHDTQH